MADFEKEMQAFSARMGAASADESVAYTRETYRSGGKTIHRENGKSSRPTSLSETDRHTLQEWMEARMLRMIQQQMTMVYVLVGIALLLSLLALLTALII